jgi:diacylglycerol kinase (ATP)
VEGPNKHRPGLSHAWHATGVAWQGLRAAWKHEDAFRQELLVAAIAVPVASLLPVNPTSKALLIASLLLVLIVELINSAIEAAVDHTSLDVHPLAKRAKDIASAAVFLSIVNAVVVWILLLLDLR